MINVVIATYNRPASLRVAIRSVVLQTVQDWRLLVVGDACDDRTAAVVAEFHDARIAYVNLPVRCGEQAIPNTVGMALAEGDFIALLNHDDIWLADHLAHAASRLKNAGGDLFVAQAAFARFSVERPGSRRVPLFAEVNPLRRELGDVFHLGSEMFEPCSSWVFRRGLFDSIGGWHPAAAIFRTPMEDWLLRAWRAGARLELGDRIGVLRMLTHYQNRDAAAYEWNHGEHDYLEQLLTAHGPDEIRGWIRQNLDSGALDKIPKPGFSTILLQMLGELDAEQLWLADQLLTPSMAEVFRRTGWDAFDQFCRLSGFGKGHALSVALKMRTGQSLPPVPDVERLLEHARQSIAAGSNS